MFQRISNRTNIRKNYNILVIFLSFILFHHFFQFAIDIRWTDDQTSVFREVFAWIKEDVRCCKTIKTCRKNYSKIKIRTSFDFDWFMPWNEYLGAQRNVLIGQIYYTGFGDLKLRYLIGLIFMCRLQISIL